MSTSERLDLKLSKQDKELFIRAAALEGSSVAAFLRAAAKDRAQRILEREARIQVSEQDFQRLNEALESAFEPNAALKKAIDEARGKVRRA